MENWLILGILSYLSYAISSSIDKHLMNCKYEPLKTNTIKMFFDGLILLAVGFIFFDLTFTLNFLPWFLALGILYATAGVIYFTVLKLKNVSEAIPLMEALGLFFLFTSSVIVFNESLSPFNLLGVLFIILGIYLMLVKNLFEIPKLDKAFYLILFTVALTTCYSLMVKNILYTIEPIDLAIMMYFSTVTMLFLYQIIFEKRRFPQLVSNIEIRKVFISSFFGAMGTLFLYVALSYGYASLVYSLSGLKSVFIFFIAWLLLKERFSWYKFIGVLIIFLGISFIT